MADASEEVPPARFTREQAEQGLMAFTRSGCGGAATAPGSFQSRADAKAFFGLISAAIHRQTRYIETAAYP